MTTRSPRSRPEPDIDRSKRRTRSAKAERRAQALARTLPVLGLAALSVTPALGATNAATGTWKVLPTAPITLGLGQTSVWTGREVIFSFPETAGLTSAAYNPATNGWRRLADQPVGGIAQGGNRAAWTGKEMLVFGSVFGNAAYKPATDTWRPLPRAGIAGAVSVWTGKLMIGWGDGCCGDSSAEGAAYSPATNKARKLPRSPLRARQSAAGAWTGKELVIVGGADANSNVFADAAAYNPTTRRWRKLPSLPTPRRNATAVWDGRDVLVMGGETPSTTPPYRRLLLGVFAYRPATNKWRLLRPMPRGRTGHLAVWTGKRLLVVGGLTLRKGKALEVARTTALRSIRSATGGRPCRPLRSSRPSTRAARSCWTGQPPSGPARA